MFERRLRTIGLIFTALTVLLLGRLVQVQVFGRTHYAALATEAMTQQRTIETTRGRILDIRGRVIAEDVPSVDAAIDFRAVTRDTDHPYIINWITKLALQRVRSRPDVNWPAADAAERKRLLEAEQQRVRDDIETMWHTLAEISGQSIDEIEETRGRIENDVRVKRRQITWRRYRSAVEEAASRDKPAWYNKWLTGAGDEELSEDEFDDEQIFEQQSPHVVLRALTTEQQNQLGLLLNRLPGLVLQPSTSRVYPFRHHASHVIGYLTRVQADQLAADPDADNDLRAYLRNDLAGRDGIESLAERTLRGTRGVESQMGGDANTAKRIDPIPGGDVVCTLDMALQERIRDLFLKVKIPSPDRDSEDYQYSEMHGAAVVIDVPTGEVRAMVSNPDYDLNDLKLTMGALQRDEGNRPLFHRATMSQFEPGSTVKPIVGLSAISAGVMTTQERIECTGYLIIRGRKYDYGRCWTETIDAIGHPHHNVPSSDPHQGPRPELDGHLDFFDAVQRSCNVYCETVADKLGGAGIRDWFGRFGLGRYTGIGLVEMPGLVAPRPGPAGLFSVWTAGIGQGEVQATPLQIANAMATIARGGEWARPKIVRDVKDLSPWQPKDRSTIAYNGLDRYDLHLAPDAVNAAHRGMVAVVHTVAGSAYRTMHRPDLTIAGKTGTAQAAPFRVPRIDANGKPALNEDGTRQWDRPRPGTWANPNPQFPWYRASDPMGEKLHHAWVVGFAPAERPTVAFAIMIEYAGAGGGSAAGPVATQMLDACIEHGYVQRKR